MCFYLQVSVSRFSRFIVAGLAFKSVLRLSCEIQSINQSMNYTRQQGSQHHRYRHPHYWRLRGRARTNQRYYYPYCFFFFFYFNVLLFMPVCLSFTSLTLTLEQTKDNITPSHFYCVSISLWLCVVISLSISVCLSFYFLTHRSQYPQNSTGYPTNLYQVHSYLESLRIIRQARVTN